MKPEKDWKEEYEKLRDTHNYSLHKLNKLFETNQELTRENIILSERVAYLEAQVYGGSTK